MPYKDPERKRQWEREHREERNALRRAQRIAKEYPTPRVVQPATLTTSQEKPTSGWKVLLGFAIGAAVVVLGAISGVTVPPAAYPGGSGSANPT